MVELRGVVLCSDTHDHAFVVRSRLRWCRDMLKSLTIGASIALASVACKETSSTSPQESGQAPAGPVVPAARPAPSVVVPAAVPAPPLKSVSWARFHGEELLTCTDKTGPADKLDAFVAAEKLTLLKQSCDSLGRPALTACAMPSGNAVLKYYSVRESDKHMARCIKDGGTWSTNKSPEAQMARAEQELTAAKAAAGIQ